MSDYREAIVQSVTESLVHCLNPDQLHMVTNTIMHALNEYEITKRCTDLEVIDPENEKLIKRYCACLIVDGKSKNTIYQYRRTIKLLSDFLHKPFTEMSAYDVRFYLACEKERGLSNASLENTRMNIGAFFSWMATEDIITKNPMLAIKPIKCPKEIKKPFSTVEIDALKSACKSLKDRSLIEMLLSTGVRVSELADLRVEDINFSTLAVHILHGKGDKERYTYTTDVSVMHLKKYLMSRREDGDFLFYNKNHEQLGTCGIRFILNTIARRAGVENVHPHRFRRTFATGLAARGMDIQEIQKLLGHSNINTTMTYVYTNDEQVRSSYRRYIA